MFITKGGFNLFIFIGLMLVFLSSQWLIIWVWLECMTLALIVLLQPSSVTPRSAEAVSKYFIMQALASVTILFGVLYRFYLSKSLDFYGVYDTFSHLCMLLGVMMKLAVFPNPFWFVDVVSGISLSRSFYLVVVSKVAPLYLFFNLSSCGTYYLLGLVGLISVLIGSMLGINQTNIRKIIALSSVANLGWFIVCAPLMSGQLVLACFLGYMCLICPVLWLSGMFSYKYLHKSFQLYHKYPSLLGLIISLLALGGLPPFMGFFIKWIFFQEVVSSGLLWVGGFLVISSLLSLYFYLVICFNLYSVNWEDPQSGFLHALLGTSSISLFILSNVGTIFTVMGVFFVGPLVFLGEIP